MGHLFVRSSILLLAALAIQACSSSDSSTGTSSSGGTSGTGQSSSGTSGTPSGGSCTGDIANCPAGTLSAAQLNDECSILSAALDDPPGTKLSCPSPDRFIVVNSKEQCVAQPAKSSCKLTFTQLIACFKAAKKDACGALGDDGACAILFDPASGCL